MIATPNNSSSSPVNTSLSDNVSTPIKAASDITHTEVTRPIQSSASCLAGYYRDLYKGKAQAHITYFPIKDPFASHNVYAMAIRLKDPDSPPLHDTLQRVDYAHWITAVNDELNQLLKLNTWELTDLEQI